MLRSFSLTVGLRKVLKSILFNTMSTKAESSGNPIISICHMKATNDKDNNKIQVQRIVEISKEQNANVW